MAIVGEALKTPEAGWRRIDDSSSLIKWEGVGRLKIEDVNSYNGSYAGNNSSVTIKFYGTKFRIIGTKYTDRATNVIVEIDGKQYTYSERGPLLYQALLFEKTNLYLGPHIITIKKDISAATFYLDAIDIDDTGHLIHPILNQVSDLKSMEIGDCIPCRYIASSGNAGSFTELGTCIADEISISNPATPNGLFYFIKVDTGTLIADRVIQNNISWDNLNLNNYIEGSLCIENIIPTMTSYTSPSGTASASIEYSSSYAAYKAFDKTNNDLYCWYAANDALPAWLSYDFNELKLIKGYAITTRNYNIEDRPKDFTFEGWNENTSTWDILDSPPTQTNWGKNEKRIFFFENTTSYKKYRVNILTSSGGISVGIGELELLEKDYVYIIRSLNGGCSYLNTDDNLSLTDKGLGAFPINNEWDKYLMNSDLNKKITKKDNNIWHFDLASWCRETSVIGMVRHDNVLGTNAKRIIRGAFVLSSDLLKSYHTASTETATGYGFRPVLEYIDPDNNSKQTNFWY